MRLKIVEEKLDLGLKELSKTLDNGKKTNFSKFKDGVENFASIIDEVIKEFPDFLSAYTYEHKIVEIRYIIHKEETFPFFDENNTKESINQIVKILSEIQNTLIEKRGFLKTLKHNNNINDLSYVYAIGLPSFDYFDELSDFTKDLNFVLKTIVGRDEKAKIVGFDVGSEWYLIGFDTYIAFKAFGLFVKESYKYLKRKQEDKERIKELKIENEQLKQLEEAMTVANQIFIQDGLNKLAKLKDGNIELTPEQMTQNLKALEIFSDMLEKNMKVDIDKQPLGEEDKPPISLPSYDKVRNLLESSSALLLDNSDTNEE